MLIGLGIRDVVLAASLDLAFGPGLTVLTGETGAGKSIILDALGLALGARGEAGLVRRGAAQATASALFAPGSAHPVWTLLDEKGLVFDRGEDLVLRRALGADGRSRAFVNDQAVGVGILRELGEALVEAHGQHETIGLLDARTHRPLLDAFGALEPQTTACAAAWTLWREARDRLAALEAEHARTGAEREALCAHLTELDRLAPREGEEAALANERATLSAAERAIADIAAASDAVDADARAGRLGQAFRALGRARERALGAGVAAESSAPRLLEAAAQAVDRAAIETAEAAAAIDAAAAAFTFEPGRLEEAEQRLFALRAAARKLGLAVDGLPAARAELAQSLAAIEGAGEAVTAAQACAGAARAAYLAAAASLSAARRAAGERLARAVHGELGPLRLGKARFRVAVEPLAESRLGPGGADRVEFEIATLAQAPFAPLASIASGGELARLALALKASLAVEGTVQPVIIFDEVDQGVGGAVADAVGQRLARLAGGAQVLVVTHSPQVAARADAHWRVSKVAAGDGEMTAVEVLGETAREEEIARMLSGERITEAARAAARALMAA
jgi:DNA repair protein RecN (Recombination protein N)